MFATYNYSAWRREQSQSGEVKTNRFSKNVMMLFITSCVVLFAAIGLNLVWDKQAYGSQFDSVVVVQPGDTLWSIAKTYYPDQDVQEVVFQIRKHNGLQNTQLPVGLTLRLPQM
ncbi:LysM peptidoglycan-binding domain-containing protein [Effusibacillus dendaii]|uniref:LysM domain-containing protein n=1 Tax=Effusibacillus dendaii TaxID=2743772 RepID=A0A7I8D6D6_9BACL|nr:LysM peptidoglycan-binding domain-containing protein [Effusibacillus dendaii]BCJ85713.1 hypothetical protein skT53_06980 [Effusibacillus dendaii]